MWNWRPQLEHLEHDHIDQGKLREQVVCKQMRQTFEQKRCACMDHVGHPVTQRSVVDRIVEVITQPSPGQVGEDLDVDTERLWAYTLLWQHPDDSSEAQVTQDYSV